MIPPSKPDPARLAHWDTGSIVFSGDEVLSDTEADRLGLPRLKKPPPISGPWPLDDEDAD